MQAGLLTNYDRPSMRSWAAAVVLSIVLHLISAGGLHLIKGMPGLPVALPVKVKVTVTEPRQIESLPPKPEKKAKAKPQAPAPNTEVKPSAPLTDVPVQGVTKESLSEKGTMAAPIGNTLMTEDEGKRLESVEALRGDLSAPARLITQTLTPPPYTDDALDVALEGSFIVDVFVNLDGSVREAELRKKIGYGMDARVIAAVRASRFLPRKNKYGVAEEGWTELKFTLVIP